MNGVQFHASFIRYYLLVVHEPDAQQTAQHLPGELRRVPDVSDLKTRHEFRKQDQ
jgi:hypothetical protein